MSDDVDPKHFEPEPIIDDENPEWTDETFARAKGPESLPDAVLAAFPKTAAAVRAKRIGRPPSERRKLSISLRLDPDVLEAWRSSGEGWQSRMNDALRAAAPKR